MVYGKESALKACSLGRPGTTHYVKEASLQPIKDLPGSPSQVPHTWHGGDFLSGCGNEPLLVLQCFGLVERLTRTTVSDLTEATLGRLELQQGRQAFWSGAETKRLPGAQAGSWEDGEQKGSALKPSKG